MRWRVVRSVAGWCLLGAAAVLAPMAAHAQQAGTITGRITDQVSGAPVPSAQIAVVGTNLGTVANAEGVYTLRGVPPGQYRVRVLRVGYAEQTQDVGVAAGQTVTANYAMRPVSVQLTPVVTTATGEQRRVEVGNVIAEVNADQLVQSRPIANIGDLLTARVAGVQVNPGNMTGVGARIRIRGQNSLSLSNDPVYIIDGIRMENASHSSSIGIGGSSPSRVSDINPEEIESIEVVKGPSAATLYGTDAANGVIVIKTKRGTAGRPQWTAYTEQGLTTDRSPYPDAFSSFGKTAAGAETTTCFLADVAQGTCTQDSVTTYNLFEDDEVSPIRPGHRQQYGLQVSGGSEQVRYFLSGEYEDEIGRWRMPDVFRSRLERQGVGVRGEWMNPNAFERASVRANVNATFSPRLDAALSAGYISSDQRLPQNDNNTTGLLSNALGGPGVKYNMSGADTLYGYRLYTPDNIFQETVSQEIDRFIGALNGNWRPLDWLAVRGNFGVDFTSRVESDLCRFGQCVDFSTFRLGFKQNNRTTFHRYTVDLGATGSFQLLPTLHSKTTVGAQYFSNDFSRNGAYGEVLTPGGTTVTQGAVQLAEELTTDTRTLGLFVEEALAWRDRVFATVALRADDNSAFGADFKAVYYPKASLSWVVSDEGFFPQVGWLDQLRLRGAIGASGVQPGTTDAVQFFIGRTVRVDDADVAGISFGYLGNDELKPERTQELELGVDGTFWNGRVSSELTYYNKTSRDALVQRVLPPSQGTDSTVVFDNIGEIRNHGWEALINAQLVQRPAFGWDVTLNGSYNTNKIISLGDVPPIIGNTVDQRAGYPLNAYWQLPYTYSDANGDGIIAPSEMTVSSERAFRGYSQPRSELTVQTGFDFWERRLRLTALFDHKGGHKLYNNTERIRCASRLNCAGLIDPNASLEEQARVVALRNLPGASVWGYIEDADFIRFREVALTFTAPDSWTGRMRGLRALSATVAARNLAIWTDYTGIDPESAYFIETGADVPNDFQTSAPPTLITFRLNVGF